MSEKYSCNNPGMSKFNSSIINDKSKIAKRSTAAREQGTIKGVVYKINKK